MKQIILHVGIPKTGSSALQVFWARNYAAFKAQSVDYFPLGDFALGKTGKISSGNGAHLARAIFPTESPIRIKDAEPIKNAFAEAIAKSNCDTGLISSELFIDVRPDALEKFRDWLISKNVVPKIYYLIRQQEQFLSSSYIQQVKRHALIELPDEYVQRVYKTIPYLRYATRHQLYCDIFGAENVYCGIYDQVSDTPKGLYESFLDLFGISGEELQFPDQAVNTSLQPKEIVMMLILNKLKPRYSFSDLIVENGVRRGEASSGTYHSLLSARTCAEISEFFRTENVAMANRCFGRNELFPEPVSKGGVTPLSGASLSFEDVIECLGGLAVRFDERLSDMERKIARLDIKPESAQ